MQRNTLITLSDNEIGVDNNADNKADFYTASVLSATDYYAFGMSMKERSWQSESYRYGEQLNLMGYSYGSVMQAHVVLALADAGHIIDNVILVGSPIPSDSPLYKALRSHKNIKNVIREDIPNDKLSDPKSDSEFIAGGKQNLSPDGPHFDLARPDGTSTPNVNEEKVANSKIENLAKN